MLRKLWIPTSNAQLLQAQERLLAYHNLTPLYQRKRIDLPSTLTKTFCGTEKTLTMNAIEFRGTKMEDTNTPPSTCLVAHGLGSGLALFHPNLRYLAQRFDRVIAVDWMGFGASSRPPWEATPDTKTSSESADFFVESLKEFVAQTQLADNGQPFTFIGHSLGGLLATEYAMKYPEDVQRLYLISPAGLPAPPPSATSVAHADTSSTALKVLDFGWQNNVTPSSVVRLLGPKGPEKVQEILRRRFRNRWNDQETQLLADYLYHLQAAEPSGEYAMNGLLTPMTSEGKVGLFARRPLVDRMAEHLPARLKVHVVYGDNDWLHSSPGCEDAVALLQSQGVDITMSIMEGAGHHVYLDNAHGLHASIEKFCRVQEDDQFANARLNHKQVRVRGRRVTATPSNFIRANRTLWKEYLTKKGVLHEGMDPKRHSREDRLEFYKEMTGKSYS
tara:strand:- start:102 stop:1436 length:1335 start_codon:yes stop_codon:yes gene_type:complete